ncbi:MarR family winged helix-turn-helix transcriptional regulator [Sphingomonas canadensis]|uniref:MarR family winged helix-turn-helix transcriptional regulator n=1 Tax=Sphingomonas canadensis TaxID=1219257 RepID=A0ABW3H9E4_9SPHN|nr:MarR family winged helix-turn-helix transcriptional regulator [Sphingomonas canadensis]MCW3837601.1 MarR family winged helix-turn-helix transcriptional regulator [Sphingomonas canadensis]
MLQQGICVATAKGKRKEAPPSFRNLLTFRLHRVARISERISEQYYRKQLNLSLPECRVIGITAGYGSVSFKRVAAAANLEKSYASRVVSALVERGIMEKLVNPSDSRSVLLQLTEQGKAVHAETFAMALALNDLLQLPFASAQVDAFLSFLTTLEQQLDRTSGLIESGGDLASATPAVAPMPESDSPEEARSFELDRNFARQLHDMLGKYLAAEG